MNPLSPFLYYRRHKAWALMLVALLALAVAGLYTILGLLQETYISPAYVVNAYLTKFSLVQPAPGRTLAPDEVEEISGNPDAAQVIPQRNVEISLPSFGIAFFPFRLIGLREADTAAVLESCGVALVEGRMPRPGTNEAALSREAATALGLGIGDTLDRSKDEMIYPSIVRPLEVVGILAGDVRLGIVSYEYLAGEESYRVVAGDGLLVIPKPGHAKAMDDFLRGMADDSQWTLATFSLLKEKTTRDNSVIFVVGIPLVLLVTISITLVVGAVNQLAFLRRLPEFGVLHAVGRGKAWLASRLIIETGILALAGTGLGILLACAAMAALSAAVYVPAGFGFNPLQATELFFIAPIPLAVIGFTYFTAIRSLGRMDSVAIVERGELSMEAERSGSSGRAGGGNPSNPLSPAVFYRRHKRQAAVLIGAMALMIMGTGLFVFIAGMFDNARQPMLNHLKRMSVVVPGGAEIEPADVEAIRAYPAVARAIPAYRFLPLGIAIPPVAPNYPGEAFAVSAEDMAFLEGVLGLEMLEGRLPEAGSNEIAIPYTFARNRNLRVGDAVGDPDHPVFRDAPALPGVLTVSGIFARADSYAGENWLSFISLEFVEQHREEWKGGLSLIVIPKPEQNADLETWLEAEWEGGGRLIMTHANQTADFREQARILIAILGLLESILAMVAAVTLAGLNYVFTAQRTAEFGVLNALGFGRRRLVWRGVREAFFTSCAAWLAAVVMFAVAVLGFQFLVYDPAGLQLDFFNPTPWLFTLPVPAAVLAAGAVTMAWNLSRLDPVAIIERR